MKTLFAALVLFCFLSCSKEATEAGPTGTFMLHLHTYIDVAEVDLYGIDYQASDGRTISLDLAQLYISDIQLVKSDGTFYNLTGKNILKRFDVHTYEVGKAPVGDYKSFRFKVGLNPATNALAPTVSVDSAILNKPAMWWGSSAQPGGYVFLHVRGKIDTSADLSHTPVPFVYKIGTDAHYVQVDMGEKNFTVEEGNVVFGHLLVDYSKLFKGISLNQAANLSVTTVGENKTALAQKIANNIPAMFIYE